MTDQSLEEYKSKIESLEEQLPIEVYDLGNCIEKQPILSEEAGNIAATLKAGTKRAHLSCDETKAEVESEVRASPEAFGLTKTTEGAIKNAVVLDDRVQEAERRAIRLQEIADKATNLSNAFEHRRRMLSEEASLYLSGFFGEVHQAVLKKSQKQMAEDMRDRIGQVRVNRNRKEEDND